MNRVDVSKGLRRPDGVGNTKQLFCLPHLKLDLGDADLSEGQECGSFARGCWALCIFCRCWCPLHPFQDSSLPFPYWNTLELFMKNKTTDAWVHTHSLRFWFNLCVRRDINVSKAPLPSRNIRDWQPHLLDSEICSCPTPFTHAPKAGVHVLSTDFNLSYWNQNTVLISSNPCRKKKKKSD